jgi:hypothetical protein
MDAYFVEVRNLEANFEGLELHHVCRDNNLATNVLSMLDSKRALVLVSLFVQDILKPSIRLLSDPEMSPGEVPPQGGRDVLMTKAEDDWHLDFIMYILEH